MNFIFKSLLLIIIFFILATNPVYSQPSEFYDIYLVDVKTGDVRQVTSIPDAGEYNPSFSNDGKQIVHDVLTASSHDLYVTDIKTGCSTPLFGGEGGNDASWAPNGQYIAFDRAPSPDYADPNLYIVPADGGDRILVKEWAIDPEWSNNSKRLVYTYVWDGSVRTCDLNGDNETIVSPNYGGNPSWSPNGKYIAYTDEQNLFVVPVNELGEPQGDPIQVTQDEFPIPSYDQQPSWSNNSKSIVFHSNRLNDYEFDIWLVYLDGSYERLTGQTDSGDYDPCFSKNGQYVAFASYTAPDLDKQIALQNEILQPSIWSLEQNYPNPFNPVTTIRFAIPREQQVLIEIFNSVGQSVATLVNTRLNPGFHEIKWNASDMSSGIYFYRIEAGEFQDLKKMILIK